MHVTFPDTRPEFDGAALRIRFLADIDGELTVCAVTSEALEDHFGADSALESDLRAAFERGRARIHAACVKQLADTTDGVVLHSGYFRKHEI